MFPRTIVRILCCVLLLSAMIASLWSGPSLPTASAGDSTLQLGFPYPVGQLWTYRHQESTGTEDGGAGISNLMFYVQGSGPNPRPAVGGGQVAAARGGTVALPCPGMVEINHGGGIVSRYYPLANISVTAGQSIDRFTPIGKTTNQAMGCNGDESFGGNQVHFWVLRNGNPVNLLGHDIGGYTLTGGIYDWCLVRGDTSICHTYVGGNYMYYYDVVNDGEYGSASYPFAKVAATGNWAAGTTVEVTVSGFPESRPAEIVIRKANGTETVAANVWLNAAGFGRAEIVVPELPFVDPETGPPHFVYVRAGSTRAYQSFNVYTWFSTFGGNPFQGTTPSVRRGETLTGRITGLPASTGVRLKVTLQGRAIAEIPGSPMTSDGNGNLMFSYVLPGNAPLGGATLQVGAMTGYYDTYPYANEFFNVTSAATFTLIGSVYQGGYVLTVREGQSVVANVRGYPVNSPVSIESAAGVIASGTTNAQGSADIPIAIPVNPSWCLEHGCWENYISAISGGTSLYDQLTVLPQVTPPPAAVVPGGQAVISVSSLAASTTSGGTKTYPVRWHDGESWLELPGSPYKLMNNRTMTITVPPGAPIGATLQFCVDYDYTCFPFFVTIASPGGGPIPPGANAGPDQTVVIQGGTTASVELKGASSWDLDGTVVSEVWTRSSTVVASGTSPAPTVSLGPGLHTLTLTVTDSQGLTATDQVLIDVEQAPVANAGPDQQVVDPQGNGEIITLDGSSSDPDGSVILEAWTETVVEYDWMGNPYDTIVNHGNGTDPSPEVLLLPGDHTITLTVTDDDNNVSTDTVLIQVGQPPTATATNTATRTPTVTLTPTATGTATASRTPTATATVIPATPNVTFDKQKSKYNGWVVASISGFTPNSTITPKWADGSNMCTVSNQTNCTVTTGPEGSATWRFRTPLVKYGTYKVTFTDSSGKTGTTNISVIPRILFNEYAGEAGDVIRVYYYGFSPGNKVEVRFYTTATKYTVLATVTIAENGRGTKLITIPKGLASGPYKVVGKVLGVSRSASDNFTVVAPGISSDPTGTATPTIQPTITVTVTPTITAEPTYTVTPTESPTVLPTETATEVPPDTVTPTPTETPAVEPTATDTPEPEPTLTETAVAVIEDQSP